MSDAVLELDHVSKRFGPTVAVQDVSLALRPGEVHCLLGENGAGKSTLIKMIAGVHEPDSGRIVLDGQEVRIPDARAAQSMGIATIHQELALVPDMTVAENLTLGRTPRRFGLVDRRALNDQAREALAMVGLDVAGDRRLGDLGVARQQLIEIAKALTLDARVLILDEPTASLTGHETEQLFRVMEQLRERGVAMAFISHHLEEIARIGDRVTVLRDGASVGELEATADSADLVRLMVGRDIEDQFPRRPSPVGDPLLQVDGLTRKGEFEDVTLTVRAGEVVGLAGLVGAGRTEVVRAIAGAEPYDAGSVSVRGHRVRGSSVPAAIAAGVGHIPEDRKHDGLVLDGSVGENLGYATVGRTSRWGLVDRSGQARRAGEVARRLRIRHASLDQPVRSLSGGNQQKVVFGRWVLAESSVLLLDEPTRGVDVGAKLEIYELVNAVTDAGGAVLMVSSDLPEVLGMSDRILVMSHGRLVGELPAAEATQEQIMQLAVQEVASSRVH